MMDESVLKTVTILYAEDDEYIRKMVTRFLKRRAAAVYVLGQTEVDISQNQIV
jgi:hypothetical protein